jgi:hypothetical protein
VAIIVVPVWPGRLNFDTDRQISDARNGDINDVFSPLLTLLWRPFLRAGIGTWLVLVLQVVVIVLAVAAIARSFGHSRRMSALLTAGFCLSPWVLAVEIAVTRDGWFLAFVLASVAVAVHPTMSTRQRVALLLVGAFLVQATRQNGLFLIVPLLAWPAWQLLRRAEWRRPSLRVVAAAGMGLTMTVAVFGAHQVAMKIVGTRVAGPESVTYVVDLDEMSSRVGEVLIPSSATRVPLTLSYLAHTSVYSMDTLFYADRMVKLRMPADPRADVTAAWRRAVRDHPLDYFHARWKLFTRQVGWSGPNVVAFLPASGTSAVVRGPSLRSPSAAVSWYLNLFTDGGRWWVPGWGHRPWIWLALAGAVAAARRAWQHWYLFAMALCHTIGLFVVATTLQYRFIEPAVVLCVLSVTMSFPYAVAAVGRWGSARRARQMAGYDGYSNESST